MKSFVILSFLSYLGLLSALPFILNFDSADVPAILNVMIRSDSNKANNGDISLDYQNMASKQNTDHDNAPNPLFEHVSSSLLSKPTYVSFLNLLSTYTTPSIDDSDPITNSRSNAFANFINSIKSTLPMQTAFNYLKSNKFITGDWSDFEKTLTNLWLTPYGIGNSGFKEVFSGATSNGQVVGFSNWIQFYTLEKNSAINYHGWFIRDKGAEIALQFAWGSDIAVEKSILIGTSPEFEIAAYTLLALTKTPEASFIYDDFSIDLTVETINDNGVYRISKAHPGKSSGTHSTHPSTKKPHSTGSDIKLQQLVNNMRTSDEDKPQRGDITMNWGNHVSGTRDESPSPLFTSVNQQIFTRPVYSKLIDVYNANLFSPQVCDEETEISGNKKELLDAVTKEFINTKVFKLAFQYLQDQGIVSGSIDDYYPTLFQLWFGTYSRCHGPLGSSGWEHVFSGEWKGNEIDGQHDWVRYSLLEKKGDINYHGYDSHDSNLIGTFQYTWKSYLKKIGGFFTDTSPSFDFSILTVCALAHSGSNGCRFNLDGYPIYITSYTQSCDGGKCLSTAYPSDRN